MRKGEDTGIHPLWSPQILPSHFQLLICVLATLRMSHPPLAVFPRVEQSSVTPAHPYSISTQLCCDSEVFQHMPFPVRGMQWTRWMIYTDHCFLISCVSFLIKVCVLRWGMIKKKNQASARWCGCSEVLIRDESLCSRGETAQRAGNLGRDWRRSVKE